MNPKQKGGEERRKIPGAYTSLENNPKYNIQTWQHDLIFFYLQSDIKIH